MPCRDRHILIVVPAVNFKLLVMVKEISDIDVMYYATWCPPKSFKMKYAVRRRQDLKALLNTTYVNMYKYLYCIADQNSYNRRVVDCKRRLAAYPMSLYSEVRGKRGANKASRPKAFARSTTMSIPIIGGVKHL